MSLIKGNLIIDAGNTLIKTALIKDNVIIEKNYFDNFGLLTNYISNCNYNNAILSSVLNIQKNEQIHNLFPNIISINDCLIPLTNKYESKETLGNDRIANAVYAKKYSNNTNSIIIDIGTCIKFDFVSENGEYYGGSISPGIDLRYKALHHFTDKLPLISERKKINLIGNSTNDCLISGVINGIKGEIEYFIKEYENQYPNLTIFMTGGDHFYFDISTKKTIFADENLTLFGLNIILQANV